MQEQEQSALLERAKRGDMDAFAAVFEDLRPLVHAVASRVVGPDDADDVVMETFLKAWRAVPRFDQRSSLKTWLYRITHNCALDMLRAGRRRGEHLQATDGTDDRDITELVDEKQPSAADLAVGADLKRLVRTAVDQMDEPHRQVLLLRYADNLSYTEIAAAIGINVGTVMSRLFNAKRKLRHLVQELE